MKSRLILLILILSVLFVTGFSFARYYSNSTTDEKSFDRETVLVKPTPEGLDVKGNVIPNCDTLQDKFQQDLCRLRLFNENGTLEELVDEGNRIEREWGEAGGEFYGKLYLEFLGILTSGRFRSDDDKALNLSQDYAVRALQKADTFDLEIEYRLLNHLRYSIFESELNDSEIDERRERVKLWLHALRRLKAEKDENFDPNDTPVLNVMPPKGVEVGIAGMSPDAIKDPVLRAEYEAAIEANRKKIVYYNQQYRLRQNEKFIIRDAAKYLSMMYSRPPVDLKELENLLNEYDIPENIRNLVEVLKNKEIKAKNSQRPRIVKY